MKTESRERHCRGRKVKLPAGWAHSSLGGRQRSHPHRKSIEKGPQPGGATGIEKDLFLGP